MKGLLVSLLIVLGLFAVLRLGWLLPQQLI